MTIPASTDVADLLRLNSTYIDADQGSDVASYEKLLADDFTATLPDLVFRDRRQFLEMIAAPRPFTDLAAHDVIVRVLGHFALIHGRVTYTSHDGVNRQARYTDTWARRDNTWVCIAANVTAAGV
jgi:ketosteroid isomerase-like protein